MDRLDIINHIQDFMITLAQMKTNDKQFNKALKELFNELQSYVRVLLVLYEKN